MTSQDFDFQRDVVEESKKLPVVVDFWAEWCGPCRVLGPVLEKVAAEADGRWKLVKVNTEEHPQVAVQYRIQGIPAVKLFADGEVAAEFVGALPEVQVRRWLDENLPSETRKLVEDGKRALERGDREAAQAALTQAVELDRNNAEARALLAQSLVLEAPERARDLVKDITEDSPFYQTVEAVMTLHRLRTQYETIAAEQKGGSPEAWENYLAGIRQLSDQGFEEALKRWIEALSIDRNIDDDGPRKACVALFTWLGLRHPISERYHKAFTSALF